jgi:hypothetical protein
LTGTNLDQVAALNGPFPSRITFKSPTQIKASFDTSGAGPITMFRLVLQTANGSTSTVSDLYITTPSGVSITGFVDAIQSTVYHAGVVVGGRAQAEIRGAGAGRIRAVRVNDPTILRVPLPAPIGFF